MGLDSWSFQVSYHPLAMAFEAGHFCCSLYTWAYNVAISAVPRGRVNSFMMRILVFTYPADDVVFGMVAAVAVDGLVPPAGSDGVNNRLDIASVTDCAVKAPSLDVFLHHIGEVAFLAGGFIDQGKVMYGCMVDVLAVAVLAGNRHGIAAGIMDAHFPWKWPADRCQGFEGGQIKVAVVALLLVDIGYGFAAMAILTGAGRIDEE